MEGEEASPECLPLSCEGVGGREDTPTSSRSSGEEEEEGEITLPPLSSLHITPPSLVTLLAGL
jgi:hypothetical protein